MSRAYSMPGASQPSEPFGSGFVSWLRNDEAVQAGIWTCTPEAQPDIHEAVFERDETILVLEGRVIVEIVDDRSYELGPGDSASFVAGTTGRWKILEPFKEFFIYSG